ncbi:MAG: VWA domain-containing protein [Sedimentisphaerales bacterium]|nr:VWA domain-containing protein [Sedimentisphaerales bacterium]
MTGNYHIYFAQPVWLIGWVLIIPLLWLARYNLATLGPVRRFLAVIFRCLTIALLVGLLAQPKLTRENQNLCVIGVLDRSLSIPEPLAKASLQYLIDSLPDKLVQNRFAVVDIAEAASISKLPSNTTEIRQRNTTLFGRQTKLSDGVQMALAIAPPDTATRLLLISDGNETDGDLKEAARIAAANQIPIDVLALRYQYENEVIFKRLVAPAHARSGQTVSLRFVLASTVETQGKLFLTLNGKSVDIDPDSDQVAAVVHLKPGTNVKTISLPLGTRGIHDFKATFIPDDPQRDKITQNNQVSALTAVLGPGHVLVVDADGSSGQTLRGLLGNTNLDIRSCLVDDFPTDLSQLIDADAIILANTDCGSFSFHQQQLLTRYVNDLGGGLIMTGGPSAFGAGGWIGSPVADILPVDLDPPQKKQLPKGALVLVMHACEMPQGNYWGKKVAQAAVKTLSRHDLVGILAYGWQEGGSNWVFPLSVAGNKSAVMAAINQMQMGDMPDLASHIQAAYDKLKDSDAAQKHIIVISDGDPSPPSGNLLGQLKQAGITCTGVGIFPHSPADVNSLRRIAQLTGGRFYNVKNPNQLPQIFIKEAQVVRRALIVEETFTPQISYSLNEITQGLSVPLPDLDGYVLTGPKPGLSQMILNSNQSDPVLATCQSGLGRCLVFTSSLDSRWGSKWLSWSQAENFWEQALLWSAKSAQTGDCEILTDVNGRDVTVNIEAIDPEGKFQTLSNIGAQVISPDVSAKNLQLTQTGPGQYQGRFQADSAGNYILNLRYQKLGEDAQPQITQTPITVPFAPEYRDLSDNFALLQQVSTITGGRILPEDPEMADIFSTAGVKFPETHLPLNQPLMLIWLAVFLLDVAIRRIAFDFKALTKKLAIIFRSPASAKESEQTLERLKVTRRKVQDSYTSSGQDIAVSKAQAKKRYQGADQIADQSAVEMPQAGGAQAVQQAGGKFDGQSSPDSDKKAADDSKTTASPEDQEQSHIQQLLRAKRRAADRKNKDKPER